MRFDRLARALSADGVVARGLESSQGDPGRDDRVERERWRRKELISYIEIRL